MIRMNTKRRVILSEVLVKAGYDEIKVLRAVGYPHCEKIQVSIIPGSLDTLEENFRLTYEDGKETGVKVTGRGSALNPPALPLYSSVNISNRFVIFYFKDAGPRKNYVRSRCAIPNPSGWEIPSFAKPKYPLPN